MTEKEIRECEDGITKANCNSRIQKVQNYKTKISSIVDSYMLTGDVPVIYDDMYHACDDVLAVLNNFKERYKI